MSESNWQEAWDWFKQTYGSIENLQDTIADIFSGNDIPKEVSDKFTEIAASFESDLYDGLIEELEDEHERTLKEIRRAGEWVYIDELRAFNDMMDIALFEASKFLADKTIEKLREFSLEEFAGVFIEKDPEKGYKLNYKKIIPVMKDVLEQYYSDAINKGIEAGISEYGWSIETELDDILDRIHEEGEDEEEEW